MNLVEAAAEYGVKNLRFFIEMQQLQYIGLIPGIAFRTSDTPRVMTECVVDESRYQVADNYKITLCAVDPLYGREHYYQSDLESLFSAHPTEFRAYVLTIDGYTPIEIGRH